MAIYIVDKPLSDYVLKLINEDKDVHIVLIQDAVYLDTRSITEDAKIYAIENDVNRRGMREIMEERIEIIDYDRLIELIETNKIVNMV